MFTLIYKEVILNIAVSVIIPSYNSENFLRKTLENITSQTFKDMEIICIDDCSQDSTFSIISEFSKIDERIKPIKNCKNLGAAKSRNIGFENSTGDYIIFLDDDDIYENNLVETAYKNIKKYNAEILIYRSRGYNEEISKYINTRWTINITGIPPETIFNKNDLNEKFFQSFIWWAWDKIFKRSLIEENNIKFQNIESANDMHFVVKSFLLSEKIVYIDNELITHIFDRKNSISKTRERRYMGSIFALNEVFFTLNELELDFRYYKSFKNYSITYLEWYINTISGTSYFSLFCEIKKFLKKLNIQNSDFQSENIALVYKSLIFLSPLDYLFYLKDKLIMEINSK